MQIQSRSYSCACISQREDRQALLSPSVIGACGLFLWVDFSQIPAALPWIHLGGFFFSQARSAPEPSSAPLYMERKAQYICHNLQYCHYAHSSRGGDRRHRRGALLGLHQSDLPRTMTDVRPLLPHLSVAVERQIHFHTAGARPKFVSACAVPSSDSCWSGPSSAPSGHNGVHAFRSSPAPAVAAQLPDEINL